MSDKTCCWRGDWGNDDVWETDCGNAFRLEDGTPADNDMKFCCYCGKPLVIDNAACNEEKS